LSGHSAIRLVRLLQSDPDEYADLLDAEVTRILDIHAHAPLRTGRRRSSGQHDTRVLSDKAQQAKQLRRRLERRYRRTGLHADKQAYDAACKAARDSIMKSRADYIRSQLQEVSGDVRATWRTAKKLLHSGQRAVHDDTECADLVNKFSDFFTDKVQHIRDNILAALQQSTGRLFATRRTPDRSCRFSSR